MTMQQFDTVDVLRLEVEADPDGLVNLVPNPSGELGGWGWITPVAGTTLAGVAGPLLRYTSPTPSAASHFYTEPMPMGAGEYAAASWVAPAVGGYYRARFEWLNAAGGLISSSTQTAYLQQSASTVTFGPIVAPATTEYVRLRFDHYQTSGGANPVAGSTISLKEVTVAKAATAAELGTVRTNLETNPSFETNSTGWDGYVEGDTLQGAGRVVGGGAGWRANSGMRATSDVWAVADVAKATAVGIQATTAVPVTGGKRYAIHAAVRPIAGDPDRDVWIDFRWLDVGGVVLGTDTGLAGHETPGAYAEFVRYADAPAGATQLVRIVKVKPTGGGPLANVGETHWFDGLHTEQTSVYGGYFDGATIDTATITYDWNGTAHGSTSKSMTADVAFIEPVPYLNVLGSANNIKVRREALNLGTLEAAIPDSALDPAQVTTIRPGRRVRLVTADGGEPLFTGKILNGKAVYDPAHPEPSKRVRVTMTAVDNVSPLAQQRRAGGVEHIAELPYVLEGCGVPWNVNGSGDQVPTATVVALNTNATAIDQVAITRDNHLGHAWVDRRNVLQAWDAAELDATVAAVLDESAYSGIAIDYDTDRCINIVTVVFLRANGEDTEEITYGPYVDSESVRDWGEHSAEFRIQWAEEDVSAIEAYAAAILTANATPVVRVNSVRLPIRTLDDLAADVGQRRALLDLYDLVTVSNTNAGIEGDLRVATLEHTITGSLWAVEVGFVVDGSVAPPQVTPSPPASSSWWPEMKMLYGAKALCPPHWLVMDGGAFDPDQYPALADHLESLGLAPGVLPNMTDVFPIGAGTKALGSSGGSPTAAIPAVNHTGNNTGAGASNQARVSTLNGTVSGSHDHGGSVAIMPPWRAVYYIIRAR
jgi:hypothetical protein